MKKNVIFSANTSWYLFNFRKSTIKRLIKEGHNVICIAPHDKYSNKLSELKAHYIELNFKSHNKNPFSIAFLLIKFLYLIWRHNPDIIFNFTIKNNIIGTIAAFFFRVKVVNNISGLGTVFINNNFFTKLIKLLYKFSQKRAHIVFCQNYDDMSLLKNQNLVLENKLKLIPGSGVNLNYFKSEVKKEIYGKTFLYLGRLIHEKGLKELTEAFELLSKEHIEAKLMICGSYDDSNPRSIDKGLLEHWKDSSNIELMDHTDDPKKIFMKTDYVILPSYREGMPRSLLEASAMGIPTLASDVPGCRDAVIDGMTGFLFKPKDSKDILIKMRKMISLDSKQKNDMSVKAREHMSKNFNEEKVINAYLRIVNSS